MRQRSLEIAAMPANLIDPRPAATGWLLRFQNHVVCKAASELNELPKRFHPNRCVIDGLPWTHAIRAFAARHAGIAYMNFINEARRGAPKWGHNEHSVRVNRTATGDSS